MARPRTGSAIGFRDERGRHRWKVGITLPDGTRAWKRLPSGISEARARGMAGAIAGRLAPAIPKPTAVAS